MTVILIVCFLVILFGGVWLISANREDQETKVKEYQDNYIKRNEISSTTEYEYVNASKSVIIRYIVDNENKNIILFNHNSTPEIFPFAEIIGCEILTDSEITGGVGRAIVGGVLAGGVGAVVGSTTSKKHITTYQVVIYRENIANPQEIINLINTPTKTYDADYKNALIFATAVNSSIKAIVSTTAKTHSDIADLFNSASAAEELRTMKELLDDGIITQDEFDAKKRQLLGL